MAPPKCHANLAKKALDVDLLGIPGAKRRFLSGRAVVYRMQLSPSEASRMYTCELIVYPGRRPPRMYVVSPDLTQIAGEREIPHIYASDREGVQLCLYYPKHGEWHPSMKLSETFVPWTVRWLWYFEIWLLSGEWHGGGMHPNAARRRYGINRKIKSRASDERTTKN